MKIGRFAVFFVVTLASCSGSKGPTPLVNQDGVEDQDVPDASEEMEVCQAQCQGRECGGDDCGGICGECSGATTCSEDGLCTTTVCESSKDCPLDLVCHKESGLCVACTGDEDCPDGQLCGGDYECHQQYPCVSDKECKEHSLVCDKDAGVCVECLTWVDCEADFWCQEAFCVQDVCEAGARECAGSGINKCVEDGSGWAMDQSCEADEYCEQAECHQYACAPAFSWCDGSVAFACSEDGRAVVGEEDCATTDRYCSEGTCIDTLCVPDAMFCADNSTAGLCAADGMSWIEEACPAGHYCQDGECHVWVCTPEAQFCQDMIAALCNALGSGVVTQQDCELSDQICVEGECMDYVCVPDSTFCAAPDSLAACAGDGLSFDSQDCADGTFCLDGQCVPWVCVPGTGFCQGQEAQFCNIYGSGPEGGGVNCLDMGGCCHDGACQEATEEICDGMDNDCDGLVDEEVLSPCGDCNPGCQQETVGPDGNHPFSQSDESGWAMETTGEGYLQPLAQKPELNALWVANSSENTISKIDTNLCQEVARYKGCSNPSRTAVDLHGNVWVGCRADGGVMKIGGDPALCKDANGDGQISTSQDLNGDGIISGAELLATDECIQLLTYPGGSCQRAVGVDRENHPWVGEWNGAVLRRLSPVTGEVVQSIGLPNNPYGLVVDGNGIIWISGRGGNKLMKVDPESGLVSSFSSNVGCFQPYGITLDSSGRVWIGNCCCEHVGYRFDPVASKWAKGTTSARPRGVAGGTDGRVYVANDDSNKITVLDAETLQALGAVNLGAGRFPVGIGIDMNGHVWSVNQSASTATRVDPLGLTVECEVPVGNGPYTYSDMTGYVLHNFTAPDARPFHVAEFEASQAGADWLVLKLDIGGGGALCPPMSVLARVAGAGLVENADFVVIAEQVPVQTTVIELTGLVPAGQVLQVKVVFPFVTDTCQLVLQGIGATYQLP